MLWPMVDDPALADLEDRAEFERQQFALYDTRRLSGETQANAVVAAALAVAAFVLADYARQPHPHVGLIVGLIVALVGLVWAVAWANLARFVSWTTPRCLGGAKLAPEERPSDIVKRTLYVVRHSPDVDRIVLRRRILEHWLARAESAFKLSELKDTRLRWSLLGFVGPLVYFAARLLS